MSAPKSRSPPTQAQMIETLWARSEVERVMLNFGRALDLGDWPLYRSCFADRFRVNFERLTGQPEVEVDADLWTRFAEVILSPVRRHHQYSNFSITLEGDRAEAVVYMVARHWKPTDGGAAEYIQNGWYENTFQRIDDEWKITRLLHTYSWITGNGALFDMRDPELVAIMAQVFNPDRRVGG
ncbi:MAG TPA: nuclear transport factor 2 family protein [Steroidobacteraceae bacterium]|nr:nuclear transport factor 2 family protein [Steroidobacteraceae bacterium]